MRAREGRLGQVFLAPVDLRPVGTGGLVGQEGLSVPVRVEPTQALLCLAVARIKGCAPVVVEQVRHDSHDARGVQDVQGRLAVRGGDLDRRVLARGRRSSDQEGQSRPRRSISFATSDHLVQGRRDRPREPDQVAPLLDRGVQDPVRVHHDTEVDHLVVVAAEDDPDDVLPDVVDVALHGR